MEIIVIDPTYDHPEKNREEFLKELKEYALSLSDNLQLSDVDIGRGASLPGVLLLIGGLFFLGKKINENIEAWISLAKKFKMFIENLRKKSWAYRIDEEGATLLAIGRIFISEQGKVLSIEKICEDVIAIYPFSERINERLKRRPDSLFFQIFKVNNKTVYIFGIKSKGSFEIEYRINTDDWMRF